MVQSEPEESYVSSQTQAPLFQKDSSELQPCPKIQMLIDRRCKLWVGMLILMNVLVPVHRSMPMIRFHRPYYLVHCLEC